MSLLLDVDTPWLSYSYDSNIDHFALFCEEHCRQVIDDWAGEPLILEDWQYPMMGEALCFDDAGMPIWTSIAIILPRKNGKTTMMAAYALYVLLTMDGSPEILLSARTDAQAGRLFDAADKMVMQDPLLKELLHVQAYKGQIHRRDKLGSLYKFSAESGALDGWNPSLVIADELHAWETPRERKAFAALASGFGARTKPQMFTITTAGDPAHREDSILGVMLDGALAVGELEERPGLQIIRDFPSGTLVYNYTAPTDDWSDISQMKLANPASWITEEKLSRAFASHDLTRSQKLRYYGGVWASGEDAFITAERWEELCDPIIVSDAFKPHARVGMGLDGSRTYDTTVVALAAHTADGRIAVRTHVYSTRPDAPHHVLHEEKIRMSEVEDYTVAQFNYFDVQSAAYDPRYLQRSAELIETRLGEARIAAVEPTSTHMRDAIALVYSLVKDGDLVHDGDPVLAQHIKAIKAQQDDRGWILKKRTHKRPIDAAVAMCLAVWRCHAAGQTAFFMY